MNHLNRFIKTDGYNQRQSELHEKVEKMKIFRSKLKDLALEHFEVVDNRFKTWNDYKYTYEDTSRGPIEVEVRVISRSIRD